MKSMKTHVVAGLCALGLAGAAQAEPIEFFQVEGVDYASDIPTPESYFGYGVGDRPLRHDQMVGYLTLLANSTDRISVETIGYSHEGRPIQFFVVTSPDNHARLDEIKAAHHARRTGEAVDDDTPLVLWANYGVHGAESSGMDAAVPALYHFAAAQGEDVERQLDQSVMLITAVFNPDGHSRRINHVETFMSQNPVTDPAHIQHDLWIKARTNHYNFDLNRQWLLLTQPESQAWIAKWHEWKPMVSADYHEMGSSSPYHFHPGEPLRRNALIDEAWRDMAFEIGRHHAEFFDSEARLYSTEEGFDNFYVGKGSTYPQINGAVGILFEIGAARGGLIETPRGEVSHGDNVRSQFRTTLTTFAGALAIGDDLKAQQTNFVETASRLASQDQRRGFVFTAPGDPERARRFVELLNHHDIEVHQLAQDVSVGDTRYSREDAFVVAMDQDQYRMIRAIFDRPTEFEENIFYDVSGWTLPLAYDLTYDALEGRAFAPSMLGDVATGEALDVPAPPRATYGYVFAWEQTFAPRALHRLHEAGVLVRVASEGFSAETTNAVQDFQPGAVFVPLIRQDQDAEAIHDLMRTIASEDHVRVHAVTSGLTPSVGRDLGAWTMFHPVEPPNVLVLMDDGLSHYEWGEMWWTLDTRGGVPVTLRQKSDLGGLDWSRYTHLILVGGNARLSEAHQERVNQWIREEGGTLIATRQGAFWAQEAFHEREAEDEALEEPALRLNFAEKDVREAEHIIGGAIFETDIDITHPMAFGVPDRELAVLRNSTATLVRPEGKPYAVVAQYSDAPLMAGYASERRLTEIGGTPAVIAERHGRGAIVLFADNPVFRGTFPGTEKLLFNAVFLSDLIESAYGTYEEE